LAWIRLVRPDWKKLDNDISPTPNSKGNHAWDSVSVRGVRPENITVGAPAPRLLDRV